DSLINQKNLHLADYRKTVRQVGERLDIPCAKQGLPIGTTFLNPFRVKGSDIGGAKRSVFMQAGKFYSHKLWRKDQQRTCKHNNDQRAEGKDEELETRNRGSLVCYCIPES